jgi:hypothetical protein
MPDLEKMQQLLKDRQSPKGKGRASAPMPIMLDADLAVDLEQAKNRYANAESEVAEQEKAAAGDKRVGGGKPPDLAEAQKTLTAAQKALDEAQEAADEHTVQLVFTALKADEFDELIKQHPPRDDDEGDQSRGYDRSTFPTALLVASPATVVTLDGDPFGLDPAEVISGMSHGEKDLARSVVLGLNVQTFSVPFSAANSRSRQRSGGKSRRR